MSKRISSLAREIASGRPVVSFSVGDSMEPLLYHRQTRVVIAQAVQELKPGDLPVYQRPSGDLIMHRIIRKDAVCYYTRGDNRYGLEKVPKEWVLGVVTEIYRKERHFSVTDPKYRFYVRFWSFSYPVRWIFHRMNHLRLKIKKQCNKRIKKP